MPELDVAITGLVVGDTIKFNRTYTTLPVGITITKVYLTIKAKEADLDAAAILQISITGSLTSAGQITDASTSDGSISFNLIVSAAQSAPLTPKKNYYYDFQGIASDAAIYTFEKGRIKLVKGITDANS